MSRRATATLWAFELAARVPQAIWLPLARFVSLLLAARPPKPLRQWALNAGVVTGRVPGYLDRVRAQVSWFRNTIGSLQLGHLTPKQIRARVRADPGQLAGLLAAQQSNGVVIALPHMGSWDLAGAYACVIGLPVTSVAERLPAGQYEYFSRLRARLGFEIYPYDQHGLIGVLGDDVLHGRAVCLIADRDFHRHGIAVQWPIPGGHRDLTVPPGPVLIAQQTGADLYAGVTWFDGKHLRLSFSDPIVRRHGADGAGQMAQQMVDFFASQIAEHPTDWHMMQRFFPGETA
ncbi:hypothetical protein [Propionimicrobium sp. PCR01-08-3]|uniref:LpxL/LpxP family acyltransferase n=1 Tax=Propionimicrobium sp. PCR01-08-3 TaxID=3052086 RepID=UPI00255C9066|nr:hypothetical protein [Propionimicrobium sp. PCR01-08-3]WIY84067.1 hypothetical protein QQ658_06945 [Propionimicrobium sp. PCR01-08-3]